MSEKNIPINKGNYSMEPGEREVLFEQFRGEAWPEGYRKYRDSWSQYPKEQYVSDYPLLVDLELSSICNLSCPMCYTVTDEFKAKVNSTLMDFPMFKKVIDEIAGKVPAIRLSLRGEPTLHPDFLECIKYAKKKEICEVSTLTNGTKLSPEFFTQIMRAGIDWITISIDGLDDVYESIRMPQKFADIFQRISEAKRIKTEYNTHRPVIKIQSIWPAIKQNPEKFYNTFAPYVDLIAFNPLIDYLSKDTDIIYEERFSCPQLYQRMVIGADGKVMMCSNDEENIFVMGDINTQTVYDIWHGDELERMREIHKKESGFQEVPICRKCYIPRKTEDNEFGSINGRAFVVKNYVNRKQMVGE